MSLISVVLPVYNESKNIAECLRRLDAALAGHEHELLVCYDFDEDTTLPAIAAMPDRPASVRLVKNDFGRGAANALRAGFRAAQGDVVVTTMADLSDPPELIPVLAAKLRSEGAAVVAGSRYCRGGSQQGGPLLKRTFSRLAGMSLKWLAGLRTADATNNFRAYSKTFLDSVEIEAKQGFEIALELTVKAQLAGLQVAEVPSSWRDRSAGESRFRMWSWMPYYLRWWWAAMAAPVFVWATWLGMTVAGWVFVKRYGSSIPFWDDLEIAPYVGRQSYVPLEWFWRGHNEHRIAIPKLIFLGLMRLYEDFRALMWCQVFLLSLVALAMILTARRLRGRTSYTDAFFPLLWLTWGNASNLLMGFQVSLILPSAITCAILMLMVARPGVPRLGTMLCIGLCLLSLPLNGAPGLTPAPALVVWLAYSGWMAWRSPEAGARRVAWAAWIFAAATTALIGLYFVDFDNPRKAAYNPSLLDAAYQGTKFLSLVFGPAAEEYWPWSGWALFLFGVGSAVMLVLVVQQRPEERVRVAGLACLAGGILSMALATGLARGTASVAAFANRYVTLPSPLLCVIYFAWVLYGPRATGRFVRVSLYSIVVGLLFYNIEYGARLGGSHSLEAHLFMQDIDKGLSLEQLAQRHWTRFYNDREGFEFRMAYLQRFGIRPFDQVKRTERGSFSMFVTQPLRVESDAPPFPMRVGRRMALIAQPPCALHFDVPPDARAVRGEFGIFPEGWRTKQTKGARFSIELVLREDVPPKLLWERTLRPTENPKDRGLLPFEIELPPPVPGATAILVLRTSFAAGQGDRDAMPCWRSVAIQ
jgi:glycosyltransferase involved in cell wall biosynthesis